MSDHLHFLWESDGWEPQMCPEAPQAQRKGDSAPHPSTYLLGIISMETTKGRRGGRDLWSSSWATVSP